MKKITFSLESEINKIIKVYNLNNNWNKAIIKDMQKFKNKKIKKKEKIFDPNIYQKYLDFC